MSNKMEINDEPEQIICSSDLNIKQESLEFSDSDEYFHGNHFLSQPDESIHLNTTCNFSVKSSETNTNTIKINLNKNRSRQRIKKCNANLDQNIVKVGQISEKNCKISKRSAKLNEITSHPKKSYISAKLNVCKTSECEDTNIKSVNSTEYKCHLCDNEFKDEYLFLCHKRDHRKEKLCKICNKIYTHNSHLRIHSGEKPYSCSICSMSFTMNQNLQRHYMRIHSGVKPFQCQFCSKSFPLNDQLKSHLRVHTGERPFCCILCGRTFSDRSYYSRHLKSHSAEEKNYKCQICFKQFNSYSNLYGHMRIHSKVKRFVCQICDKGFNRNSHLKNHAKTHNSPEKLLKCTDCSKRFTLERSLRKHQTNKHVNKLLYSCNDCHQYFISENYLNEHKLTHLEPQKHI